MTSATLKTLFLVASTLVFAIWLLAQMISGDFMSLAITGFFIFCIVIMVRGAFGLCLAIGITCPILLTLPGISGVSVYAISWLICGTGAAIRSSVLSRQDFKPIRAYDRWIVLFYAYIFVRYLANPALPGAALGISQDLSGFRSWFDHLLCAISVFGLGYLVRTRGQLQTFFHSILVVSVIFSVMMLVMMFIPSARLTHWLEEGGVMIAFYGNGLRRFVMLPTMGLTIVAAALLPMAFRVKPGWHLCLLGIGVLDVLAGGNRTSFIGLLVLVSAIFLLKRRYITLISSLLVVLLVALAVNSLCRSGVISMTGPFVRVFGLFNQEISLTTGGEGNIDWRLMRWERAIKDISERPFFGYGYGGMQGYMSSLSQFRENSEEFDLERDMATGSTHNGYLSAARAFGIPAALLCAFILARQCYRHFRKAKALFGVNSLLFEWHALIHGLLLVFLQALLFSCEIRLPDIWLYVGIGFIVFHLGAEELDLAGSTVRKAGAST